MKTLLSILAFYICNTIQAQNTFSFLITDQQSLPVVHASIQIDNVKVYTDTNGRADIVWKESPFSFSVQHENFESQTVVASEKYLNTVVLKKLLLPETIVYAFESGLPSQKVPASVSYITKGDIEKFNATQLLSSMNAVAGVKMDERSPGSYRISIRGNLQRSTFGIRNVKIYWNGVPFTDANGTTYLNQIAPEFIHGMEILKGPSSSMYGAGTSGVVLMHSKNYDNSAAVEIINGNYGLFKISANYAWHQAKQEGRLTYSHTQTDGYRNQSAMRRDGLHYSTNYVISDKQKMMMNLLYSDLYYQTPGALTMAEMQKDPAQSRPAAGVFRSASEQQAALRLKTLYAALSSEWKLTAHFKNTTGIYASFTNFKNPSIRNYERKLEQGVGARTVFEFRNRQFQINAGGEYQYGFANTATFGNKRGVADTLQYHDEIGSVQYQVFLQGNFIWNKWSISSGLSINNFQYNFQRLSLPGTSAEQSKPPHQLIPRIAIGFEIAPALHTYFIIAKGYSPPSIDEVHASDGNFNRNLQAEKSYNYELGFKAKSKNGKWQADLSLYFFKLTNTIVSRRDSSGADYYINAGNTHQKGLEAAVKYLVWKSNKHFIRSWNVTGNYTRIHARYKSFKQGNITYDGNAVTGTVPNIISINSEIRTSIGWYTNIGYAFTGATPLNDANTFYGAHFNQLFFKTGYHLPMKWRPEIYFLLEKSFNNPYAQGNDLNAAANRYYNPSPPYLYMMGIRFQPYR